MGQLNLSDSTAWRQLQKQGAKAQALEAARRLAAMATPDRKQIVPGEVTASERLAATMDGGTPHLPVGAGVIHIRDEGWKELKVGGIRQIELAPGRDPLSRDVLELAHTVENTYVAHLGGPEVFGQQLRAEAQAGRWTQATETIVLGDGSPSLCVWNLAGEHFYDSVQVAGWYHAKQHLAQTANLIHGEGTPAAQVWLKAQETVRFEGHAEQVADCIAHRAKSKPKNAKELRAQAGYYRENRRRMQYLERREEDFPIGSGLAESGCKQFRARFTAAGMRWRRPGAERLLLFRVAVMSHRFDVLWSALQAAPLN